MWTSRHMLASALSGNHGELHANCCSKSSRVIRFENVITKRSKRLRALNFPRGGEKESFTLVVLGCYSTFYQCFAASNRNRLTNKQLMPQALINDTPTIVRSPQLNCPIRSSNASDFKWQFLLLLAVGGLHIEVNGRVAAFFLSF